MNAMSPVFLERINTKVHGINRKNNKKYVDFSVLVDLRTVTYIRVFL